MGYPLAGVNINPGGNSVSVTFLTSPATVAGSAATAYQDTLGVTTRTLPDTITAARTYYLNPGYYYVSVKFNGVEQVGQVLGLNDPGELQSYAVAPTGGLSPLNWSYRFKPTAAVAETMPRESTMLNIASSLATGTLAVVAIWLPSGLTVQNISFVSGTTAAGTPTHWWFALLDSSRNYLAQTADQTSGAWAANTEKKLAIAQVVGAAATSFVTTYTGLHYLAINVTATTPPTLLGLPVDSNTVIKNLAPVLCATSDTSLTTPPSIATAAQAGAFTVANVFPYAYVS